MLTIPFESRLHQKLLVVFAIVFGIETGLFAGDRPGDSLAPNQIVDFERHVAPLLGRLGCNSAACHGAFGGGKGGLQLSLFGHSAKMDYQALKDRIDPSDPDSSPLLLKPSGQDKHDGGVRFEPHSDTFKIVKQWIEQGSQWNEGSGRVKKLIVEPDHVVLSKSAEDQELAVTAEYFGRGRELVTRFCQFTSRDEGIAIVEPSGRVLRSRHGDTSVIVSYGNAFAAVSVLAPFSDDANREPRSMKSEPNFIDMRVDEKLALLNIVSSGPSSDEEFLRRVTLDAIGAIPTPEEVTQFCRSSCSDKREKKIDELLTHPMHAALWATRMCDITKCDADAMGEDDFMGARRALMWHDWFRKRFERNTSYSEIVRGIVTATSRDGQNVLEWMNRGNGSQKGSQRGSQKGDQSKGG
jgi:hypothetical protein